MIPRVQLALLLCALSLLLPAASRAATPVEGDAATSKTITDIRNVGTAMWTWYKDEVAPKRSAETHKKAEDAARTMSVDISAIPAISHQDLAKVLVPKYIAALPEKDGWGHPYEFHLDTRNPDAVAVMGLRSAGRDGRFSGSVYKVGSFAPADLDQDIPWVDGYFVRWPQKPGSGR
jgi:hypothetical protein